MRFQRKPKLEEKEPGWNVLGLSTEMWGCKNGDPTLVYPQLWHLCGPPLDELPPNLFQISVSWWAH